MTLWGPLSEEDYVNDFEAVIELLDETAFRDGVGSDILVDYYKSARRVVREEESIDELDTDERENAIRFFEFGSYVRKLSEAPVIDFNGKNVDKDLGDLYKTDLEDKPLDFIHELRTACMYLDEDHEIALIDEEYSEGKVPEFRVLDTEPMIDVECKRPNPNKNNNAEKIPQKLAGVIAGAREKFNKRTQNLIHIEIPSIFQLSPSQNERLRHEVKGEIVERSPIINGVFLQQVGQKEKEGDPRSIVGVKGPDGDTTILDSSLDFIPHYFEQPDDFTILGRDVDNSVSAHQTFDDATEVGSGPEIIEDGLDAEDEFTLQGLFDPSLFFDERQKHIFSNSGTRILVFGGRIHSDGNIRLRDIDEGEYHVKIPQKIKDLRQCHIFLIYGNGEFSVNIMPVDSDTGVERIQRSTKDPSWNFD